MGGNALGAVPMKKNAWTRIPLVYRILAGALLGMLAGVMFGKTHTSTLKALGAASKMFIDLLKALATPMIFFAVLDALIRTHITGKKGIKLVCISLVNAVVAIVIGLGLANLLHFGDAWKGHIGELTAAVEQSMNGKLDKVGKPTVSLDFIKQLESYIPKNFIDAFQGNNIITVVLIALLAGAAMRRLRAAATPQTERGVGIVEDGVQAMLHLFAVMLGWIVEIIPFAIFGVVSMVVGEKGLGIFSILGAFLGTILLGLAIHSLLYYSLLLAVVGRVSPLFFFRGAYEAIVTALSCGSSLATLPVTLRCLKEKLKISDANARLAACVGTNLNHTGIILYEAAATIFIAQALGRDLSLAQQVTVALASVLAGMGIAGVPEAGFITLQLVLNAGGIEPDIANSILPLLLSVDWIIGRGRAATNVISDMTVATLLEKLDPEEKTEMLSVEC